MKYNLAVCGGTFDHFHKGHKEFLRFALSLSDRLLIGLTTDNYVRGKNKGELIQEYQIRKQQLGEFLIKEKAIDRVYIEPIDDIFIPKAWQYLPIEAIIVSHNTVWGAERINLKRKEQGKSPLRIEIYPLVKSENNEYISSSKIRKGNIDREGRPYVNPIWFSKKLVITEKLRRVFKKPFGKLIKDIYSICHSERSEESPKVLQKSRGSFALLSRAQDDRRSKASYLITVGDITTKRFNDLSLNQNISVIDFKVAREKKYSNIQELGFSGGEKIFRVNNPAGCITPALFKVIIKIFKLRKDNQRMILQIEGEEDLSVLPLILAAPLGSIIFYGQPGKGVVKIKVESRKKEIVYGLVSQFKVGDTNTRGY